MNLTHNAVPIARAAPSYSVMPLDPQRPLHHCLMMVDMPDSFADAHGFARGSLAAVQEGCGEPVAGVDIRCYRGAGGLELVHGASAGKMVGVMVEVAHG